MKSFTQSFMTLMIAMLLTGSASFAQKATSNNNSQTSNQNQMKTYIIERNIPNAGQLTAAQLQSIAQKSCSVVDQLGPQIQWDHSYVVDDKLFCVYRATNEDLLWEHGKIGGFPVDSIYEVKAIFGPESAKGKVQMMHAN